ncbi:MAG: hypothetical protein Q8S32_08440 [Burkholderiaceae bacterium]|nr:hypothetical protein [Burkholderiaceae bacterium]
MIANYISPLCGRAVTAAVLVAAGISGAPQAWALEPAAAWSSRVSVQEHSVADGLPVLALDRDGWQHLVSVGSGTARAAQRVSAAWEVEHPSGWRLGVVARSQASVSASPGALALAQAVAGDSLPTADTDYPLAVSHMGWRGRGLALGLPWQALASSTWQWTADAQWLQLTDMRHTRIDGSGRYQVASQAYGFDVHADRASRGIAGPFLGASGTTGEGYSVSFALKGHISPQLAFSVKADDVLSRLTWNRLAREQLRLNTQVTVRRPDGFLDYAPAISGQQSLQNLSTRVGARYDTRLTWQYAPTSAVLARWHRLAGMDELWLGWGTAWPDSSLGLQLGLETVRRALAAKVTWHGFYADLGTDFRGSESEYRQITLGLNLKF